MGYSRLLDGGFVVLLGGHLVGCAEPATVADPDISEGEAVLAALEHVAALKWEDSEISTLVEGKAAAAAAARGVLLGADGRRGTAWCPRHVAEQLLLRVARP